MKCFLGKIYIVLLLACSLAACESSPNATGGAASAKSELHFVDLQGFDRDLASALVAPLPKVEVAFYDRVSPSSMPARIQPWMASVEAGGGKVNIVEPKSSVAAKSPFMLISLIWSATKMARETSAHSQFKAAQGYDADIILKVDDRGESVVDKVVFVQRKK